MIHSRLPFADATVASLCRPVLVQLMLNHAPLTVTASVNVTPTLASRGAIVEPLRGSTLSTYGPISLMTAVRRGLGVPVTKSEPLTFVSVKRSEEHTSELQSP